MRAPIALLLVLLVAAGCVTAAGCATATPSVASDSTGDGSSPGVDVRENGRVACLAVRKVSDTFSANVLTMPNEQLARKAPQWAGAISQAARGAADPALRTSLLSMSDVVRGWSTRPPDRSGLRGFQNDLQVACRPYLTATSAASAS